MQIETLSGNAQKGSSLQGNICMFCQKSPRAKTEKGCKSSAPKQIVHKQNDEMHKENEYKCAVSKNYRQSSITGPPYKQNP